MKPWYRHAPASRALSDRMGYPFDLALRYLASKKSQAFVSVGTAFAMLGVTLGVAALATVMSVTGGFQQQFREKVLGVNAHVLVLKYINDFHEYREVMKKVSAVPHVIGVAPFVINPMMVTHGTRTATGVLLKGIDPDLMPSVLDLPKNIHGGTLEGLRRPGTQPPAHTGLDDLADPDLHPLDPTPRKTVHLPGSEPAEKNPLDGMDPFDGLPPLETTADGGIDVRKQERLLQAIRNEIAHDEQLQASAKADAGAPAPSASASASAREPALAAGGAPAPSGDVTPAGGYASQLPADDDLPEAVDPDPCHSAAATAQLPGVVVGYTLMNQLGLKLGDCLQITSPLIGISIGAAGGRPPIAKQFRVIAYFEAGFEQYDAKLVYTDLYEAQTFYENGDSVTGVEMKVDDIDKASAIAKQIDVLLGDSRYHTMDWSELNHGLFTALLIQQILMSVVLTIIIVVAAFTVVATLIMVVLDKRKEIALLKALGARDLAILRRFLYQGGIIGMLGTGSGLLLGYICCTALSLYKFPLDPKVYFIDRLPVLIRPTEFLITGGVAVLICLVATIFPALYAARLRPTDGLRAE